MSVKIDKFISDALAAAIQVERTYGLPAAAITAQACLETGFGASVPRDKDTGQYSYNLFGIKGTGPAGHVSSKTWEVYGGVRQAVMANFRAYQNYAEAFEGYAQFIQRNSRYCKALFSDDPDEYLEEIHRAGYATDPEYVLKLQSIMDKYSLRERARAKIDEVVEVVVKPEPWMEAIMQEARQKGLITSDHNATDPADKWFVLAVALNLLKAVGNEN